ncbi:chloride channel protein [Sediminicurvatus halobius]|uniref:Chloride channel protein n=1 Tax=Sediminicurvatus halobius TaxID=2182432 RepID=A0A2U2N8V4_9GAMM|nr:chloride channel protein [Spiribacter halobius]PWG65369.1 chloride channel protein [Spiribacter halobius]UEX76385.1 chloride channel protein [Spiribacter halobius]
MPHADSADSQANPQAGERAAGVGGIVLLGVGVGSVVSLLAASFVLIVLWLNEWLLISPRARMMFEHRGWITAATVAVPTAGGLLVGLLHRLILERRAHGPAEVIAAVQTRRGRLAARPGLLSAASSLIALGSGASVGQYGPLVHLGGSLGSGAARLFRCGRSDDNIAIACGVAAAIATAFKAPIAGILFAHEVVLRHYALRAFAPVAAAAVMGYVVEGLLFEREALFYVASAEIVHAWEYAGFVAIGGVGALLAVTYMHAILWVGRWAPRTRIPAVLRPAAAGAAIGLTALWLPDILGIGGTTLRFATIEGAYGDGELALIMVAKLAATALCLGFGFSGGVFSPALVIGALFGALCGGFADFLPGAEHASMVVYAVCGMVAVTAPVIGAPLATLLIVFELTASYTLTTAALASLALANLLAARLFGRSLFDVQLHRRGLDLAAGRDQAVLQGRPVASLVSERCTRLDPGATPQEALASLERNGDEEGFLVDADERYRGTVTAPALRACGRGTRLGEVSTPDWPLLTPESSLWEALHRAHGVGAKALPVVAARGRRRFLGVVTTAALAQAERSAHAEIREEEQGAG